MIYLIAYTCIGCAIGNFAYQFFTKKDYAVAFERTFFQVLALIALAVNQWMFQG